MNHPKSSLFAALALTVFLAFAIPARAQDTTHNAPDQDEPQSTPNATEEIQSAPQPASPSAAEQQPVKKQPVLQHTHKKKKPVHKAKKPVHHPKKTKKPVKKKPVHKHRPVKKTHKQTPAPTTKTQIEQEPLATVPGETEKQAVDKSETAVPPIAAPAVTNIAPKPQPETKSEAVEENATPAPASQPKPGKLAAMKESVKNKAEAVKTKVASVFSRNDKNAGGKTVTYTFCMGYDNCVPYRYEAMVHGSSVDAKMFKKGDDGEWAPTAVDPIMNSDLCSMAKNESGNDVMRPLSLTEKARIADHQGKTHADLVAAAQSGNKDDLKRLMIAVGIKNENDLEVCDPRLAKNDTAVAAAKDIAAGR